MKKFKLFKSGFCEKLKLLLIPIGLLIGSFTMPAWGTEWYSHNNASTIWFNDYTTDWVSDPSSNGIAFLMGRDNDYGGQPIGSRAYRMTHIAHTKLWYCDVPKWGNDKSNESMYQFIAFRFVSGTTGWDDWQGGWDNRVTGRAQYGSNTKYAMTYNHNITGRTHFYTPSSSSANTAMSVCNACFDSEKKFTAYLRVNIDEERDGTYDGVVSGDTPWGHGLTFDFTGTYMNSGNKTSGQSTIYGLEKNYWLDGETKTWGYGGVPITGEVTFELKTIATGFEVAGWAYSESATSPAYTPEDPTDVTFQVLGTTSYVAFIRRKSYTITLNDNGGSGGSGSKTVKYDRSANMTTSVSVPSKTGYDFQGYYTGQDGTGSMVINASGVWQKNVTNYTGTDGSSNPKWIRDDGATLYAKWTQTVDLHDNHGGSNNGSISAIYNGVMSNKSVPTYTDHTLDLGYYAETGCSNIVMNLDGTLVASVTVSGTKWTSSDSKWIHNGGSTLYAHWKVNAPSSITCTDNVVTIAVPTDATVHYTTNGTTPTASSPTYDPSDKPVITSSGITVKAIAVQSGCTNSEVTSQAVTYTPVYTVTHTLSNASKSSGETSVLENKAYTAVYEDATGYDLPDNITVTVGSTPLTLTTDYTWNQGTGTLSILANRITGNVVITINGVAETYDGAIEGNEGSDGGYTATYDLTSIDITTEPERLGFDVEGYYIDEDLVYRIAYPNGSLVESSYKNTTPIVADHKWMYTGNVPAIGEAPTIYTKWTAHKYTVYLDQEGGSGGSEYFKVEMNTAGYEFGDGKDATMTLPSKTGYDFTGYYTAASDGTQVFDEYGNAINNTTGYVGANAKWACTTDNITLHAQWEAKTYDITLNDRGATTAGIDEVTATYNSEDLSASITNPAKWGSTFGGWAVNSNGTGTIVIGTDGKLVKDVAGYTDASGNWKHDGNVNLYAVWTPNEQLYWIPGANSSDKDGAADGAIEFTSAGDGKYYVTIDTDEDVVFHLGDGENAGGPSSNTNFTLATSSCGLNSNANTFTYNGDTKQTVVYVLDLNAVTLAFEHLVIYKPGEDEYDLHTAIGAVDGFSGTIYGQFEYRQRVDGLNKWSTLYLPYKPTLVQAWGGTSYHNLYPCHRLEADGPLYQGYYVIRTPGQTTNLPIKDFKQWNDPTSYSGWTPEANTPYIIMWQLDWFRGKYISFWGNGGDTGVTFGSSFVPGAAPTADGVVNVLGNGTMVTGYVAGAYVLAEEYGDGAWLRGAEVTDESTVGPFECYIRANAETTGKTLVIKRRTGDDTTTGWDEILNYETKEVITVYTISGLRVAQYKDCSFEEAGRRMNAELSEGIYILNAGNESVKLIIR